MKSLPYYLLLISIFSVSCSDLYVQDEYEELHVVEAWLVAGRQLPHIRLSTTAEADASYDFEHRTVDDANVEVRLLSAGAHSEPEEIFPYALSQPGTYNTGIMHQVQPLRTYELKVTFPASPNEITAHTIVPDTFQIKKEVPDSIEYRSEGQLEITVSKSSYPGRQNIFIFNALSSSPEAENLTPMYRGFYEEEGQKPEDLDAYANSSSGIINEGNFEINTDGSFTIQYPWMGFTYYGPNLLVANTIDDNAYDYIRSQSVQLGGSTLSPGEIQNVIHNIKGGIGIFGSIASDTTSTYVKRSSN